MAAPASALEGGFSDPARVAAAAFRSVMEVMARPGVIQPITGAQAPAPCSVGAATVLLTLCDTETPVYLAGAHDTPEMRSWLAFHTGAPISGPADCMFALGEWDALMPIGAYPVGTAEYPDRSATLVVEMPALEQAGATLRGPGIKETAALNLPEQDAFVQNRKQFPLGVDFIFAAGAQIAALPRSTEVS